MDDDLMNLQNRYIATSQSNKNQSANLDITEKEIEVIKSKNERYNTNNTNKVRQIQINTQYQKKYSAQIRVLQTICLLAVTFIVLAILKQIGILPQTLFGIIIAGISIVGILFIGYQLFDILLRDKSNPDEYDHSIYVSSNPSTASNKPFG